MSLLTGVRRDPRRRPWTTMPPAGRGVVCNICGWRGQEFDGRNHCESATCPSCGAIARDRFLYHCFVERVPWRHGLEVLETSPRLGNEYRAAMRKLMRYRASDLDQVSHRADLVIDLQSIDLADQSIDIMLTPHVLEHVPDTDAALCELLRVLRPGGHVLIQVPVLQGVTAPPTEPEFHEDNTPVFWRFGLDLTDRLRAHGFVATVCVTHDLKRRVDRRDARWSVASPEFDTEGIVRAARSSDLTVVASDRAARRHGFFPSYMFITWDAVRP